jgi:sulfite oxidase
MIDLFQYDPERINAKENFFIRSERPFNAETKPSLLVSSFLTPVDRFYVRNHMHVPVININEFKLELQTSSSKISLSYDDLQEKFSSHTITSVVQCAGNRRFAMNNAEQGTVQGTPWYVGAIGNAQWTGVRLRDVLQAFGLDHQGKHVQFFGLDCDSSQRYVFDYVFDGIVFDLNGYSDVMVHRYPWKRPCPTMFSLHIE